jgi:16S rRNA (guanine966-N2)-methyltransferase
MSNTVRIIGGRWRGRKLHFPDAKGLRPTPDRVRETIFNWLMHDIYDATCLDAFAGSGALGLEALSRGAKQVIFLEQNPKACEALTESIQLLQCQAEAKAIFTNTELWLKKTTPSPFDLVFLDPPFQQNLIPTCLSLLKIQNWLKPSSLIYIECESSLQFADILSTDWEVLRDKQAGEVRYGLIKPA